jgi:hypothetical protein
VKPLLILAAVLGISACDQFAQATGVSQEDQMCVLTNVVALAADPEWADRSYADKLTFVAGECLLPEATVQSILATE